MEAVRVENVKKIFQWKGVEVVALNDVSLSVQKGEKVALWGPSGAGKTTLLHIIGTLEKPTEGRVYLNGMDVTDKKEDQLSSLRRNHIGFIFQFHHLFPELTALENVITPLLIKKVPRKEAEGKGKELLEKVGLGRRLHHRPGELSGGERQRVAVARALIMEPLLVLADEPTGDLDSKTGEAVFQIMLDLVREKSSSLVVATHNEKLLENFDTVLEIVDGKIITNHNY